MATHTRSELQRQAGNLEREVDQRTKHRDTLRADRDKLAANVAKQAESIDEATFDGQDVSKQIQALAIDRIKLEGLNGALRKAEGLVQELQEQYALKQKAIVLSDCDVLAGEAYSVFLQCMGQLSDAVASLDALSAKLSNLNRVGAGANMRIEHHDHLSLLDKACRTLRGDFNSIDGIPWKIRNIEQSFPALMSVARERKGH